MKNRVDASTWKVVTKLLLLVRFLHESFAWHTLSLLEFRGGRRETIVKRSRQLYATHKTCIEYMIARWMKYGSSA